ALERVSLPGEEGWREQVLRVHRGDGPRWQHEVDEAAVSLLAGMRPDGLPLYDLVELLAVARGADEVSPEFAADALSVVGGLVRHGLIRPVPSRTAASGRASRRPPTAVRAADPGRCPRCVLLRNFSDVVRETPSSALFITPGTGNFLPVGSVGSDETPPTGGKS